MTIRIRKSTQAIVGGPGAVGIRFDPSAERIKVHDGSSETVVPSGTPVAAAGIVDVADLVEVLTDFGILTA